MKISFMKTFSLLLALGLSLGALENINEIGQPIGAVHEGIAAEKLLKHLSDVPYGTKYISDNDQPFKYRLDAQFTTLEDAGSSTAYKVKTNFFSTIEGSAKTTNYTRTVNHARDRYTNNFKTLKSNAQSFTIAAHLGAAFSIVLPALYIAFVPVVQTSRHMTIDTIFLRKVFLQEKRHFRTLLFPAANRALKATALTFTAALAYLGYKNVTHYGNITEEEYLSSRAQSDRNQYYRYDDLARECPRPNYYRDLLIGLIASGVAGIVSY